MTTAPPGPAPVVRAAGAGRRYAAWSLDAAAVGVASLLIVWPRLTAAAQALADAVMSLTTGIEGQLGQALLQGGDPARLAPSLLQDPRVLAAAAAVQSALFALCLPPLLAYALLGLAWHVGSQCGPWRASPGQRALGLVVVRADGARASPARLLLRYLATSLSWLTLNLGHALALVPPHRALHDLVSGTRVDDAGTAPRLPGWATAWLGLQALLLLWLLGWGLHRYLALVQAALA